MRGIAPEVLLSQFLASGAVRPQDLEEAAEALRRQGLSPNPAAILQHLLETGKITAGSSPSSAEELPTQALASTQEQPSQIPRSLSGRFSDWRLLGRGGMGVVYYAYDSLLQRPVAIKLLLHSLGDTDQLLREARHQAHVEHPNICPVFEVGEAEGTAYVVMHYVAGASLLALGDKLPRGQLLALFARIARAAHFAHQRGLVHGDIKPANMLLEVTPEGLHPWLVDFGMASALSEASPVKGGTPAYIAPELLHGAPASPAGDIFSLGASLFHMLAGKPPEESQGLAALAHRANPSWQPPPLPEGVADAELAAIVAKAMARDPEDRYSSALAFAEDLERYLAKKPLQALPDTWGYRARKWYQRQKAAFWLGLGVLLALLGSVATSTWVWQRSRREAALRADLLARVVGLEERVRKVWTAPAHQVSRELAELEEELQGAAEKARKGGLSEEAVHYLLGRAFLAMGKAREAQEELARAWNPKRPVAEIALTFAEALVSRYRQEAPSLERLPRAEWRAKKAQELEEWYLKPAQALLATVQPSAESSAFVEALLAAAKKDWAKAAAKAREAFAAKPWQFEALLLEGDAHMELAKHARETGRWDEAIRQLQQAEQAFATLANQAPSHPLAQLGLGRVALERGVLAKEQGLDPQEHYKQSLVAVKRALALEPELLEGHVHAAYAALRWADYLVRRGEKIPDPLQEEIRTHVAALEAFPEQAAEAKTYLGIASLLASRVAKGEEVLALRNKARENLVQALQLNPRSLWAINNLGFLSLQEGMDKFDGGLDPTDSLQFAAAQFRRLAEEFPDSDLAPANLTATLEPLARWVMLHGQDPRPLLAEGQALLERYLVRNPRDALATNNLAALLLVEGMWLQWNGGGADEVLGKALQLLDDAEVQQAAPEAAVTALAVAVARLREALLWETNPRQAREVFQRMLAALPCRGDEWEPCAAAAEGLLLSAVSEPQRAQASLARGYRALQAIAKAFPRQPEVCRVAVAYAVALGSFSPRGKQLPKEAAVCLEHWRDAAFFQQVLRAAQDPARQEPRWPGLAREVELWRSLALRQGPSGVKISSGR